MKKLKEISAFFPAYNDEGTVELMVERLHKVLKKVADDYEIIIIDDCSPDKSGEIADKIAKKDKKVGVVHHKKNKGYGGALKSGFGAAKKEWVFYTDGDAQYDVGELENLVPFSDKYDVINGYKISRGDEWYRALIGNIYNWFVHAMFNLKVKDVDGDFRLIRRKIFDDISLESNTGSICLEMMKKIQNAGYSIKNVPVHHYPRVQGKSQFFRPMRIIRTLLTLFEQWYNLVLLKKTK